MESKKTTRANLENKRGLFLQIGFIVALLACALALGWSQQEKKRMVVTDPVLSPDIELTPVTRPPEEAKPMVQRIMPSIERIRIVSNDRTIVLEDIDWGGDNMDGVILVSQVPTEEPSGDLDDIFIRVENMPTFLGSENLKEFAKWVQARLRYPQTAQEIGIQGTVVVTFVVGKDGAVTQVEILNAPDKSLAEEALRVVQSSPRWEPGKQRGNPAQVRYNMPVVFKIQP